MRLVPCIGLALLVTIAAEANAQVSEGAKVQAFCDSIVTILQDWRPKNTPIFDPDSPNRSKNNNYEYFSYRGKAIPIREYDDEWVFLMADGLASLDGGTGAMSYIFGPAGEEENIDFLHSLVMRNGLPTIEMTRLQHLKYAVSLDFRDVTCDNDNPKRTTLDYTSLVLKSLAFSDFTAVYDHNGGLLAHIASSTTERWKYVFEDSVTHKLFSVEIHHRIVDGIGQIGIENFSSGQSSFSGGPLWMKRFFDAINNPGADSYTALLISLEDVVILDSIIESLKS